MRISRTALLHTKLRYGETLTGNAWTVHAVTDTKDTLYPHKDSLESESMYISFLSED